MSVEDNSPHRCGRCGVEVPADAPGGGCPRCALDEALRTPPDPSGAQPLFLGDLPVPGQKVAYFGDYELVSVIAQGGMGVVYRARHLSLKREVALKLIRAGQLATEAERLRFRAEAEAAAQLDHPHIVAIYEAAEHQGQPYFSMQLVEGRSLAEAVKGGPMPLREAAALMVKVARAVHHAHQRGVIHRDLKPSNILLDADDEPHVTDFGLAKLLQRDITSTRAGSVLGTPAYMAPEQAAGGGKDVTTAADVYALGAVLYQLITGRVPFAGGDLMETLARVQNEEPTRPSQLNVAVDRDLETICLACLEKESAQRYASAEEVAEELERWLDGKSIARNPPGPIGNAYRWVRRKPMVASLGALALLFLIGGVAGIELKRREAARNLRVAEQNAATSKLLAQAEAFQRDRAEERVVLLGIKRTDDLLEADRAPEAVAQLASLLRQQPTNCLLAERLLSTLAYRSFVGPPLVSMQHGAEVTTAEFTPEGNRVLTASWDGNWYICDSQTGRILVKSDPTNHAGSIALATISPNGRLLATAPMYFNPTPGIWDTTTGKLVADLTGHENLVVSMKFSPDGACLLTASWDGTARLWNCDIPQKSPLIMRHEAPIQSADFSPDSHRIITTSYQGRTARLWEPSAEAVNAKILQHPGPVTFGVFSQDSRQVLTTSTDGTARIWDAETGAPLGEPLRHPRALARARFSPNGNSLVTAMDDGSAWLWDVSSRQLNGKLLGHEREMTCLLFSPDGQRIASASFDGTARIWSAHTGEALSEPLVHGNIVWTVAFSQDGFRLVTASRDAFSRVWSAVSRQVRIEPLVHNGFVGCGAFSPDGGKVVTGSHDCTARLWDTATARPICEPLRHGQIVASVGFSPSGQKVATASYDGTARLWDAGTGNALTEPLRVTGLVSHVSFSRDGRYLLTCSYDIGSVQLWDTMTGERKGPLIRHPGHIGSVTLSSDARWILTAGRAATIWDAQTGATNRQFLSRSDFESATFSPNGELIMTASIEGFVQLWDVKTCQTIGKGLPHRRRATAAEFSPDGRLAVTVSEGIFANLWDLATFESIGEPLRHGGAVKSAHFSPDGLRVVTAAEDGVARVWDARTGIALSGPLKHGAAINDAMFSPDNRRILTVSKAGTAKIWDIPICRGISGSNLADLAECIAGLRVNDRGTLSPVTVGQHGVQESRVLSPQDGSPYLQWMNWLVGDPASRTISPYSAVSVSDYLERRALQSTPESLQECLLLCPTNAIATARLALRILAEGTSRHSKEGMEALFLSKRALKLAPESEDVWQIRAKVLERLGGGDELVEDFRQLCQAGASGAFWPLVEPKLPQSPEVLQKALERLTRLITECPEDEEHLASKANALLFRAALARRMGRNAEAESDVTAAKMLSKQDVEVATKPKAEPSRLRTQLPPRPPDAGTNLVDLTPHYNGLLQDSWQNPSDAGNTLEALPTGVQEFGGVRFDARGVVQLRSRMLDGNQSSFPRQVQGIAVQRPCRRLHFLHGTGWISPEGREIARYVIHYADGTRKEVPVQYGAEVRGWHHNPSHPQKAATNAVVAWIGSQERWAGTPDKGLRLYRMAWENPRPDVPIESLDFVSAMEDATPFLIAITVE